MSKLFSSRKRFIGLGLMSAFVIALAVLAALWGVSQRASANDDGGPVSLVHINADGTDYTGNPYCPGTVWDDGKIVSVDPVDYCNNITSRNHVIRTEGFVGDVMDFWSEDSVHLEGVGEVLLVDFCWYIPEAFLAPEWNHGNDWEVCIVIHSKDPGESTVSFTYYDGWSDFDWTTTPVVKEWRKLHDTVILKEGDLDKVSMPDKTREYQPGVAAGKALLPKDADDDGDRDTDDLDLLNHDGEVQNHSVVVDEVSKGISSMAGPIWLLEVVRGAEKAVDPVYRDPVEGAVVLAFIDSPKHCTYFTNPAFDLEVFPGVELPVRANDRYYGTAMVGITNQFGQFVGPLDWPDGAQFDAEALAEAAAHLLSEGMSNTGQPPYTDFWGNPAAHLGVHVDTSCEEQATITFKVGYPSHVGSAPQFPEPESVTINWVTYELLKQPQIRWAGEEIVLATRWALPEEWYPNAGTGQPEEEDECLNDLDDDADTLVNDGCPAEGVAEEGSECLDDEDAEEDDPADGLVNDGCPVDTAGVQPVCPLATDNIERIGWFDPWAATTAITHHVNYVKKDPSPGALEGAYVDEDGDGSLDTLAFMGASEARGDIDHSCVSKALYDSEVAGEVDLEAKLVEATWYCGEPVLGGIRGIVVAVDDDDDGCVDEDPVDGLDNDTGICAGEPPNGSGWLAPETGAECDNNVDDDQDGHVNDGCPEQSGDPEEGDECDNALDDEDPETGTDCAKGDTTDDDDDGRVNDGCPANGEPETGDDCLNDTDDETGDEAEPEEGSECAAGDITDDDGDGYVNDGCPANALAEDAATQCDDAVDDDSDGYTNDGCPARGDGYTNDGCLPYADGYVNDGCPGIGDGLIDEDPVNAVGIAYNPDSHKFTCEYPLFAELGWPRDWGVYGDAELQSEVLINKHPFLVWYLKIYQTKLENIPLDEGEGRADHNAGAWKGEDPTGEGLDAETLNVSQDALLRVTVKGYFHGANNSGRGAVCVDMDGDGNGLEGEDATPPGEPYPLTQYELGCDDPNDEAVEHGHWVLPDDFVTMASAQDLGDVLPGMLASLDVMSDIDDTPKTKAVGPKSTLDSHDTIPRPWIPCQVDACPRKTVDPDGEITVADAIMPPLKIEAGLRGAPDGYHAEDAGFLKGADKDDDVGIDSLYQRIMIPADPEIPPFISNGGYDWDSWFCRIEDANVPSPEDPDADGWSNWWDNCPNDYNPNQYDNDGDWTGDACDDDIDGDGIANDTDACDYDPTNTCTGEDSDGDGIADADDNCPSRPNADQNDFDDDKDGDACDLNPFVKWISNIVPCFAFPGDYYGAQMGPYEFYDVLQTLPVTDCPYLEGELCNANIGNQEDQGPEDAAHPRSIEFYTDNRGMGFFFVNGDYNLDFGCPYDEDQEARVCSPDGCRLDPLSGAPDCSLGDVVGESNIKVISQYPYTRAPEKLRNAISNTVVKTWEWGGFKTVTAKPIDANHTAIIAHLKDRDGFCAIDSPSEHPVYLEEIEFTLNTGVGSIISGAYDGVIVNKENAIVLAGDEDLFDDSGLAWHDPYYSDQPDECQAWVLIEHPLGAELDVSVLFNDPEGVILRHWPLSELTVGLVQGWNDVCYADEDTTVEDAMADIIDDVMAVYRFNVDQTWDRHFPGRCDEEGLCTLDDVNTLESYDQLFILMAASADWTQVITALPVSVPLAGASAEDEVAGAWNSVCYAGLDKATDEATLDIGGDFVIMYSLGTDQMWRRYVPDRPEIPDTLTTLHTFDSVILLVTAEGGTTWVFDP